MADEPLLTPDELAMLLGDVSISSQDVSSLLRSELDASLLSLLQRSSHLTLEAEVASHRLRFPLVLQRQPGGEIEPQLRPPVIEDLTGLQPRPWRLHEEAHLISPQFCWRVLDMSERGMVVDTQDVQPQTGALLEADLCLPMQPALPLTGRWVRKAYPPSGWALTFTMPEPELTTLKQWLFERHQDTFIRTGCVQ
ncbi:PilZ domain-containing protein [Aeromonas simiae]|uniref:PilZ domain-containing protein n=1 Tax=Aeromonas simiae TaxID=218936 RepID=UPI0005AABAF2|nr:PilZ domain-containing protein [Aeromonas simiae]MDO2947605.1 PilZ domain-containing protein [Aeromonas simiae]MDO2955165.1 PilZ domain-containing protein [Aeromonas simiae]